MLVAHRAPVVLALQSLAAHCVTNLKFQQLNMYVDMFAFSWMCHTISMTHTFHDRQEYQTSRAHIQWVLSQEIPNTGWLESGSKPPKCVNIPMNDRGFKVAGHLRH